MCDKFEYCLLVAFGMYTDVWLCKPLGGGGIQFQLTVFFSILGNFSFKQGTKLQLQLLPAFLVSDLQTPNKMNGSEARTDPEHPKVSFLFLEKLLASSCVFCSLAHGSHVAQASLKLTVL